MRKIFNLNKIKINNIIHENKKNEIFKKMYNKFIYNFISIKIEMNIFKIILIKRVKINLETI